MNSTMVSSSYVGKLLRITNQTVREDCLTIIMDLEPRLGQAGKVIKVS